MKRNLELKLFELDSPDGLKYMFEYGSVVGEYKIILSENAIQIYSIFNKDKGNGHFEDCLKQLETDILPDYDLAIIPIETLSMYNRLIDKLGYSKLNYPGALGVIKYSWKVVEVGVQGNARTSPQTDDRE